MLIKVNREKCNSCGVCVSECPVGAITLFEKARIDTTRCTGCRMCMIACPEKAISNR